MSIPRIGIDCRLAGSQHAGIGRYVVELVSRLTQHSDINWVLFYSDQTQLAELFPQFVPDYCQLLYTPVKHYTLLEQLAMNSAYTKAKLNLLHVPHFNVPMLYRGCLIITIHDLLWHQQKGQQVTTLPSWQYWPKYFFYRMVTNHAVAHAKFIFVPSKTVKQTIAAYYPQVQSKVIVTHEGVSRSLQLASQQLKKTPRKKQLIYVGSLYPHKNISLVITALKQLPDYSLVLVGSRSVFRDQVQNQVTQLGLTNQVSFLSAINDLELAKLYSQAFALIQPSFSEGFGLTGIEAMQFETPVLASDITIFHEIYQQGAVYFNPLSVVDFCQQVKALDHPELRKKIAAAQKKVITQYSWDTLAKKTYQVYLDQLKQAHD